MKTTFAAVLFSISAVLLGETFAPLSANVAASAPVLPITYQIQLQVRADTGGTAFNLPNGSTFNSVTPNLNDAGNVAVKVNTVGLTVSPGLWFGGHATGSLVYNANDTDALLSDPFLNQSNQASFPRFASANAANDGLYLYDNASGQTTHVTSGPLGATSYTNPEVNDNGLIGMRVKFNVPQALGTYNIATTNFINYVTETSGNPNSPYSFLYAPAFNNNNRIAAQANLGAQPSTYKELRIWNPDGSSILAASGDSSSGPVFFAMDNSISMNNLNQVAFTTRTTTAASTRRIVVADGTTTTMFPTVSDGAGFTSIDSFAPSINDSGLVAFRGNDNQATPRDSVFVTNGTTFQRIAGVNDTLMTDTGPRVVAFLMGGVSINNSGEVAFGVQFTGGGNAIYVAYLTATPTPTPSPTATPTATPSATATATATPTPATPTPPSGTPTITPTPVPTPACVPNPVVTTNADSGAGSLRKAILDVCAGGTITFNMTQVVSPITLTSGALVANKSLSVNGPGQDQLAISAFRDSTNFSPVFITGLASPAVVTLSGLTLSEGKSTQGGVINSGTGTLTIVDSTVRNNTGVSLDGAGIYNSSSGTINIIRSTVADNSSGDCGGGVFNGGSGTINVSDSTLSNNSVGGNTFGRGGGICNEGMLSVINSTISGNTGGLGTHNFGGGIYNASSGTMNLDHSTLTNNSAGGGGGGIYNAGTDQIRNSIVALNKPPIVGRDLFGTFTATYSFIGDPAGAFISGGTGNLNGDPKLGTLANNGGPTQTHLLLSGSQAIDAGDPAFAPPPANDQRGLSRVAGPRLDMGSVEVLPGPTPTPTPMPTPTPATAQALNISTRLRVETGNNVVIGGFIITGNATKNVVVRGIGPSLTGFGINDALADPTLELRESNSSVILPNDNWQDDSIQAAQLTALGLAPTNSKESALVAPLQPAAYTAILAGKNQGTGVGLVEIYDTNGAAAAQLANISTRGFVRTGENVMIGGFILGANSGTPRIVVRGIGPSLAQFGLNPVLADPTLDLRDSNGATLVSNDNWQDDPAAAAQLSAAGFALSDPKESGIFTSLPPGQFTAIIAGKNGGIGIGLIEIYNLR